MAYENFYEGSRYSTSPSSLSKDYGDTFTGYRMSAEEIGMATDPRMANQLQEVSTKLSTGAKTIEISPVMGNAPGEILDSIPRQQFQEIKRLSELTGIETTLHGPMIELSGYDRQGWSEVNRTQAENQMLNAVQRAHDLNPKGNIPVTFHSSVMLPESEEKIMTKDGEQIKSMVIVDPRTGQYGVIRDEKRYLPEKGILEPETYKFNPKMELERKNKEMWDQQLNQIAYYARIGQQNIEGVSRIIKAPEFKKAMETYGVENPEEKIWKAYGQKNYDLINTFKPEDKEVVSGAFRELDHSSIFLKDSYNSLRNLYNQAYNNPQTSEKDKKMLDEYRNKIKPLIAEGIEDNPEKLKQFADVIEEGIIKLQNTKPQLYQPLNNFIVDKSSETIANVALKSYKEFGSTAPVISIENPPAGAALSTAKEMKELIDASRDKFVAQARDQGISESEARKASEKLIGATWDVGHINMLRKSGYEKEDLLKQAEVIAPYVKHVHLSDNFGLEHTELPMGMGNVPIKEIMEKLGKEGHDAKKIIEAGNWWQHFKTPPTNYVLEAFGSPVYGAMMGPYWNQASGTAGNYMAFPSAYLPEQHFSIYGSGFSSLPAELGGQIPGKQSRMTGTPMD